MNVNQYQKELAMMDRERLIEETSSMLTMSTDIATANPNVEFKKSFYKHQENFLIHLIRHFLLLMLTSLFILFSIKGWAQQDATPQWSVKEIHLKATGNIKTRTSKLQ